MKEEKLYSAATVQRIVQCSDCTADCTVQRLYSGMYSAAIVQRIVQCSYCTTDCTVQLLYSGL